MVVERVVRTCLIGQVEAELCISTLCLEILPTTRNTMTTTSESSHKTKSEPQLLSDNKYA